MKGSKIKLGLLMGVLGILLSVAGQISAQTYGNERQTSDNLRRLQGHLSTFRIDLQDALSRVRYREYQGEAPMKSLDDLEDAYQALNDDFRAKRETADGVSELLQEARDMDAFLKFVSLGDKVTYDWSRIRTALDQLAASYKVSWVWEQESSQTYPVVNGSFGPGLSGTYRLNAADSENAREVIERAGLIMGPRDRNRVKADLEEKLNAPESLILDIRGQQVTLSSSNGASANFTADGKDKFENTPDGGTSRVRATLRGERLTISSAGDKDNDYTVIFESIENGKRLRVTRRVNYESLSQTVLAESVYDKTVDTAQTGVPGNPGVYSDSNPGGVIGGDPKGNYPNQGPVANYPGNPGTRDFIVPSGTILSGTLENEVSTKVSQNNDRFRMTVVSPNEYRGAVIEGYVNGIKRSGKINGRAQITFNFERIRLRDGATYEFAGFLQSITNANGEVVKVDTEGSAKGESQTKETVKRGGIGGAIGAVIGGVVGGVKGAVIGATIGAGAGAGSVYIQGENDLEIRPGTTVTVQATSPNR